MNINGILCNREVFNPEIPSSHFFKAMMVIHIVIMLQEDEPNHCENSDRFVIHCDIFTLDLNSKSKKIK